MSLKIRSCFTVKKKRVILCNPLVKEKMNAMKISDDPPKLGNVRDISKNRKKIDGGIFRLNMQHAVIAYWIYFHNEFNESELQT